MSTALDEAYRRAAENLPRNAAVEVEHRDGRDTLKVTGLDKLDEPASLLQLRDDVKGLLPRVDLPEVILEIQQQTDFLDDFTHISEGNARVTDLPISLCAVLVAEACNIGLEPLARHDVPALTRSRLSWVQQNYVRSDTLIAANAKLVDYQSEIPLASEWGGGEVASADGLRFVVPVRPTTLTRAIAEAGRISKTLYQLNYIDQEAYRRRILTQLNRGESRNGMGRATFHGQRGEIRKRYREGQEDQLGPLGRVVNAMVLWNTIYMHEALEHLREDDRVVATEDIARLSPLDHGHFNFLGTYSFSLAEEVKSGHLRPLRNPEELEGLVA